MPIPIACALLAGCFGGSSSDTPATLASLSGINATGSVPGVTPFIAFLELRGADMEKLAMVRYEIAPKPKTASKPVSVQYKTAALVNRGYLTTSIDVATIPIFGLYPGYSNTVTLFLVYTDQSVKTLTRTINTDPYVDTSGVYDSPNILVPRLPGTTLGFDFFMMKSALHAPVVVDSDGNVRWARSEALIANSAAFVDNGFVVGSNNSPTLRRFELDGTATTSNLLATNYANFHHNISTGKSGLLIEVDKTSGGTLNIESTVAEISRSGAVLREWDLADIFSTYMTSRGDDPANFVRRGSDWLHTNGLTYDSRDDSLIVSSRENFLVKISYETGRILWIFGDPTKYWYTFPSLREKALLLDGPGLYPVGQHAPSVTSDGHVMVFNNGAASFNQPPGAPAGLTRQYSAVSAYSINAGSHTAGQAWDFDYQAIYSDICSSAYEAAGKSLLVNFAVANNRSRARMVGLNEAREVVFDIEYRNPKNGCEVGWNAIPIPFGDLRFD
jgi:hypothetical protein